MKWVTMHVAKLVCNQHRLRVRRDENAGGLFGEVSVRHSVSRSEVVGRSKGAPLAQERKLRQRKYAQLFLIAAQNEMLRWPVEGSAEDRPAIYFRGMQNDT
jgi:hypothetical protein